MNLWISINCLNNNYSWFDVSELSNELKAVGSKFRVITRTLFNIQINTIAIPLSNYSCQLLWIWESMFPWFHIFTICFTTNTVNYFCALLELSTLSCIIKWRWYLHVRVNESEEHKIELMNPWTQLGIQYSVEGIHSPWLFYTLVPLSASKIYTPRIN